MIQDYEQHNRQKSNDSRQNNRKAVSGEFTSSWAAMLMKTVVLAPLLMHQSIPPAPRPSRADPRELALFFALDGKFPGVGTLELASPPGWGRKKRNDSRQNNRKAVSGEFTSSWAAMLM